MLEGASRVVLLPPRQLADLATDALAAHRAMPLDAAHDAAGTPADGVLRVLGGAMVTPVRRSRLTGDL